MKSELATAIIVAVIGVLAAYFVTGFFTGEIKAFSVKTIDSEVSTDLSDPDPEVFNYKALNPTVEVYVGDGETESDTSNPNSNSDNSDEDNQENI